MFEIFTYPFMQAAFIAGSAIALASPLIGSFLVLRRYSLIADTLSHAALAGIAIALITKTEPLYMTIVLCISVSLLIEAIRRKRGLQGDAILAMFLPGGLAISVILLSLARNPGAGMTSYLFGSITTVTIHDALSTAFLAGCIITAIASVYDKLLFASYDEETAKANGIQTSFLNTMLMVLTALGVSISFRIVGALLVGALMIIPVVSAQLLGSSFRQTIVIAMMIGVASMFLGLILSFFVNIPAGSTVVLVSLLFFTLSFLLSSKRQIFSGKK
jgi:zinc transport system permease protein